MTASEVVWHARSMVLQPILPDLIEVLLFDLGGVVIDIDFGRCVARWARSASCDVEDIASRFTLDAAYEEHERGELDVAEYFQSLRRSLSVDLSDDELLEGWNDIWVGVNAEIGPLLTRASAQYPLYALTNSNPTHHATSSKRFAAELDVFTSVFVSSQIGHRKPERAASKSSQPR